MTQLVTYGSVGGVGRNPGPYPAPNAAMALLFQGGHHWRGIDDPERSAPR
jgi:hypothetical protein